jgi:IS5 family transposase
MKCRRLRLFESESAQGVIVDTTVQPKNVTFPTDAKLLNRAREKLVQLAQRHGVDDRPWCKAVVRRH